MVGAGALCWGLIGRRCPLLCIRGMGSPNPGGNRKLIGLRETAALLDVPVSTLYKRWATWGLIAYRVGRSLKFREAEVEAWLQQQAETGQ